MAGPAQTGMMAQWHEAKGAHPGAILLFRVGDFYEMFYEDAEVASRVLGLTLTSRNNGGAADVPLAGIPVRSCAEYMRRLVSRGFRVAVCEQVEDPKVAKGVVRREVIETVTPGAEALFLACTALRAAQCAPEIERRTGLPVVTSNLAAAWASLRQCGIAPDPAAACRLLTLANTR